MVTEKYANFERQFVCKNIGDINLVGVNSLQVRFLPTISVLFPYTVQAGLSGTSPTKVLLDIAVFRIFDFMSVASNLMNRPNPCHLISNCIFSVAFSSLFV
jgi:hypothetical protein